MHLSMCYPPYTVSELVVVVNHIFRVQDVVLNVLNRAHDGNRWKTDYQAGLRGPEPHNNITWTRLNSSETSGGYDGATLDQLD